MIKTETDNVSQIVIEIGTSSTYRESFDYIEHLERVHKSFNLDQNFGVSS